MNVLSHGVHLPQRELGTQAQTNGIFSELNLLL